MNHLKILLAEDHPLFLAGMQSLITADKRLTVVASALDGKEAIALSHKYQPDIIIMDISMPNMDGIEATRQILSESPGIKIIALSIHTGKRYVNNMLNAGAVGYLVKDSAPEELVKAIWKVHKGEMFLSSKIANYNLSNNANTELTEDRNILQTKLYRPKVSEKIIFRSALVKQLEGNIDKPLSLISAGAGYGKSVTVSQWLSTTKAFHCWVSLDDEHNELRMFLSYFKEALEKIFPGKLSELGNIIRGGDLPTVSSLVKILINELDTIKESFIVVLDDFHRIIDKQVIELMTLLIQFPPEMMHLCLITRRDPTLNLAKLRAQNRLSDIRMSDLAFSTEEIGTLAKKVRDINLPLSTSEILYNKTEGWAVGICLSLLSLDKSKEVDKMNKALSINMQSSSDYLVEEVLSKQMPWVKELLILSSVLNRFSAELIDEIIGSVLLKYEVPISGSAFITKVQQTNLFIVPLDDNRKWFRHHHLFQDLLKAQLKHYQGPEQINSLHLTIAKWFDKNGFMEEAVQHAIKANDYHVAVDFVSNYRYDLMEKWQMLRLNSLIDFLPQNCIEESPALLMAKASIMEYRRQTPEMMVFIEKAKTLKSNRSVVSQELDAVRGEIATIEGELLLWNSEWRGALKYSNKALELLPNSATHMLSYAMGIPIVCSQLSNSIENINEVLIKHPIKNDFMHTRVQLWYCLAYAMEGDTSKLLMSAKELFLSAEKIKNQESVYFGKHFLGVGYYLTFKDDQAEPYLKSVVDNPYVAWAIYMHNGAYMLCSIYIEKGEVEKANQLMEDVIKVSEESQTAVSVTLAKNMQVELALKERNIEKALLLNNQEVNYNLLPPLWFVYVPQLTPVKLKLAINTTESIEDALQMLSEIEVQMRQSNKKTILIDVLILQAVALNAQNNEKDTLLKINEAISMSCMGNCIRTYVDYGPDLKENLNKVLNTSEYSSHIQNILNAIADRENSIHKITKIKQAKRPVPYNIAIKSDSLSTRELEIAKLVCDGLRNKEIAHQLFVSEDTVKKHLYNAYKKLGINNRIELVSKAFELDLEKID